MHLPEKRFVRFIKKHHVFTLCTVNNNAAWCASCFYAYNGSSVSLVFTTDLHTRHAQEMISNNLVAGNIHLETRIIGRIRGIQFTGHVRMAADDELSQVRKLYLIRFPYAFIAKTAFWVLDIDSMKMTDNRLGFGKKLFWYRHENQD